MAGSMSVEAASGWRDHLVSAEEAVSVVRPGDKVFVGSACATPRSLVGALERLGRPGVVLVHFLTDRVGTGDPSRTRYRHRVFCVGRDVRALAESGWVEYLPLSLSDVPELFRNGQIPLDVAMIQVAPPDPGGTCSLGISVDVTKAAALTARAVIAEVNPAMPRTHGESLVHLDRFDAFVSVDTPVTEYRHPLVDQIAEQIARYIAAIIDDGSTLQIGLGRVPNEALRHLKDRRDLGIHSDVITDGVVDLVEAGVVTNRRKTRHRDRIVASYCLGTRRLYDFVDDNPRLAFLPIDQVCDPQEVAANARMVSITQAFAVDLTGQVCVDQFAGEFYGGVSTQAGFIRGAARSPGGKPIICLASNTDDGASRIKPLLETGDGVGIARSDVHYVVTEYGIAYLFGKSIRERALALVDVAHPNCREELLEAAKRLGYVLPEQYLASQAAYPVHEERTVQLKNGATVLIRPAHASDADALRAQFHHLTQDQVYTRFFRRVRSLSYAELQTLCNVNHETEVAFLAVTGPRESEVVVGSACYFLNSTTNLAEIAFMVASEWQGQGLGTALQARLQEYAIGRGVRGFVAEMLPRNARMLRLARHARGTITTSSDEDSVHMTILFQNNARDADAAASENTRPSVA